MKLMMTLAMGLLLMLPQAATAQPFQEVDDAVRGQAVEAALKVQPKAVLVYAKGLCCPSCAIGVRKMLSRLAFIDTTGDNKGIALDAKHQLVTLKLKADGKVDAKQIGLAINDAGYAPVRMYRLVKWKVVSEKLVIN